MGSKRLTLEQRFWSKVDRRGGDECWPWLGARVPKGYGRLCRRINGKAVTLWAHRLGWELQNGETWPRELLARHSCDHPWCVNPAHITPGTPSENNRDTVARQRHPATARTQCPQGHPLSGDNLRIRRQGWRSCKACGRLQSAAHLERKKAGAL